MNKKPGVYMEKFECFYPNVLDNFLKNQEEIQKFLENKKKEYPKIEKITTSLYGMSVVIDYEKLYKEFRSTLEKCVSLEKKVGEK